MTGNLVLDPDRVRVEAEVVVRGVDVRAAADSRVGFEVVRARNVVAGRPEHGRRHPGPPVRSSSPARPVSGRRRASPRQGVVAALPSIGRTPAPPVSASFARPPVSVSPSSPATRVTARVRARRAEAAGARERVAPAVAVYLERVRVRELDVGVVVGGQRDAAEPRGERCRRRRRRGSRRGRSRRRGRPVSSSSENASVSAVTPGRRTPSCEVEDEPLGRPRGRG